MDEQAIRTRSKVDNTTLIDYLISRFAATGQEEILYVPETLAHLEAGSKVRILYREGKNIILGPVRSRLGTLLGKQPLSAMQE